jgi:N-acetylglucosaminylphosphatidylinositol deacetylase
MFFVPTIRSLIGGGHTIFVLCISNGNYEGLGRIREDELRVSCAKLGIPAKQVTVIDNPAMQDGPANDWPEDLVGNEVSSRQRILIL